MKRRFKYPALVGALCLLCLAAGTRIRTGQGYSDPTLTGAVRLSTSKEANRALDVVLTNRDSGRTRKYGWALSLSGTDGNVAIRCHEWKQISVFGVPAGGLRWNEFQRTLKVDDSIRGSDDTYDYVITWRKRSPDQSPN